MKYYRGFFEVIFDLNFSELWLITNLLITLFLLKLFFLKHKSNFCWFPLMFQAETNPNHMREKHHYGQKRRNFGLNTAYQTFSLTWLVWFWCSSWIIGSFCLTILTLHCKFPLKIKHKSERENIIQVQAVGCFAVCWCSPRKRPVAQFNVLNIKMNTTTGNRGT